MNCGTTTKFLEYGAHIMTRLQPAVYKSQRHANAADNTAYISGIAGISSIECSDSPTMYDI